ncbi:MAG: SRPBCC family protein [Telluria sp.]
MKFEHLIEVNDPLNPLMDTLTREQVWRGLVIRAESPKLFIPHLDDCDISAREAGSFKRRLRYGDLVVEDTVLLSPLHEVRYEVPAQGDISASLLTMTIESPSEHVLYVRFSYDDGMEESTDGATKMYEEFKKSAYQEADIDTMRILRQMAEQGNLDASYLN